jgi:hypothetical protein
VKLGAGFPLSHFHDMICLITAIVIQC